MKERNCRNCHWLKLGEGQTRFYKNNAYECGYPKPDLPVLPHSITQRYGWRPESVFDMRRMTPDEGKDCPVYVRRYKE